LAFIALVGALVGLTRCSSPSPRERQTEKEVEHKDALKQEVDDEMTVGRQIGAKLLGYYGNYKKDGNALAYVNLVGQTLATQSGRPELKFHFALLDSDEINAFAAPGGFVFVTKGLLAVLSNESELAGILGHEIAHVNEKHMYNEIRPKKSMEGTETVARLLSRGRGDLGSALGKMVNQGLKMLVEEGLGKEKEYAADQAGTLYASAAGYDPVSMVDVLRRIDQQRSTIKISKTHPPYPERIHSLEGFLAKNGMVRSTRGNQAVMDKRFATYLAKSRKVAGAKK
jgi:predicted Zn-dependent protease